MLSLLVTVCDKFQDNREDCISTICSRKDTRRNMQEKKSIWMVLGAGFCWGIIGVFSKPLGQLGYSPFQITALRCLVTLLGLTGILIIKDMGLFAIRIKDVWMFIGTGIFSIVLFNVCYFYTIVISTLGLAAILLYTAPFFVMLLSAALYGETITKRKVIALFTAFAGCVMVTGLGGTNVSGLAIITGLGSGIGYALYTIFGNKALETYQPLTVTFYTFLFALIGILPFSHVKELLHKLLEEGQSGKGILYGLLLGVISTLLPFILYTEGLKKLEPSKASVLAFAEPFIATLAGIIVFKERVTPLGILGLACIFLSICMMNRKTTEITLEN